MSILKLILRILIGMLFGYISAGVILVLIQSLTGWPLVGCSEDCGTVNPLLPIIIFFLLFIFLTFVFFKFFQKISSAILIILLIIGLAITIWIFAYPTKISGSNVGSYSDGQTVFGSKKIFYWQKIKRGDIVTFNREPDVSSIVEVLYLPNETLDKEAYFLNQIKVEGKVPAGHYGVRFGTSETIRIIEEGQIDYIIWLPPK